VRLQVAKVEQVTKLFGERLQAYKHAVAYLEDYVQATEKTNHAHGKEYERVLKVGRSGQYEQKHADIIQTVKDPLKQGHHFDQSLGGIAGMFENIRSNTQVRFPVLSLYMSLTQLLGHLQPALRNSKATQERHSAHLRAPAH